MHGYKRLYGAILTKMSDNCWKSESQQCTYDRVHCLRRLLDFREIDSEFSWQWTAECIVVERREKLARDP